MTKDPFEIDEQIKKLDAEKQKLHNKLESLNNFKSELEETIDNCSVFTKKQKNMIGPLFDFKNFRTSTVYATDTETKIEDNGKMEDSVLQDLLSRVEEKRINYFLRIQDCDMEINKKQYMRLEAIKEKMAN